MTLPPLSVLSDIGFSFLALTFLEVVLGVDNLVFVAVAANRLPESARAQARRLGLWLAMALRIGLVASLYWLASLQSFQLGPISLRTLVLGLGGLFLLYKSATEIHDEIRGLPHQAQDQGENPVARSPAVRPSAVILEIGLINIVFSLDSAVTAVGMSNRLSVMIAAVAVSGLLMLAAAAPAAAFIAKRPSAKVLAFAFILLIGALLVADATGFHVPRGYVYFAMGFAFAVEILNSFRDHRAGKS